MKILVTGANGMLGSELVRVAQQFNIDVIGLDHKDLDITDKKAVNSALYGYEPEIVVNCAGIVKGREETDPELYHIVNTQGAQMLAALCSQYDVKMIQISTDCVFDGACPYNENDTTNASDIYGQSKALGEVGGKHLTLRMSFIGLGHRGLVSWLIKQEGNVEGYINSKWNGITVNYAAKNIIIAIIKNLSGIVHICGHDTTKYEVLCILNNALELGLDIVPVDYPVIDRRLRSVYGYNFDTPPIKRQIKEMASDYCCNPCGAR